MNKNKPTSSMDNSVGSKHSQFETSVELYDELQSPNKVQDSIQEVDFILDLERKLILHDNALTKFLNFDDKELSYKNWTSLFDSLDLEIINHLLETFLSFNKKTKDACEEQVLSMTFRIKKQDNSYFKVLCQTDIVKSNHGLNSQLKIRLTNIDFISSASNLAWTLIGEEKECKRFRQRIAKEYADVFTQREIEVVSQMNLGLSNSEIANKLFISNHTVATHRKRLFKKTMVHNANDLIAYCKVRGLIS